MKGDNMKTIRRDWLKKQIIEGRLEIKTKQILTDDYAYDYDTNCQATDWHNADITSFCDYDFKYQGGRAWWNDDNTISWLMLSNHYYLLRFKKQN